MVVFWEFIGEILGGEGFRKKGGFRLDWEEGFVGRGSVVVMVGFGISIVRFRSWFSIRGFFKLKFCYFLGVMAWGYFFRVLLRVEGW